MEKLKKQKKNSEACLVFPIKWYFCCEKSIHIQFGGQEPHKYSTNPLQKTNARHKNDRPLRRGKTITL